MFGNFSRRDKQKIVKLVRERGRQPLSQRDTQRRKGLEPLRIFPVALEQDGGSDGTISTQASYTYTVKDHTSTDTLETTVNPITAPTTTANGGYYKRPVLGSIVAATFGTAFYTEDGKIALLWINEQLNVGPCS